MSDQADNLRQLVRAQRVWRELTLEDPPAPVPRHSARWDALLSGGKSERDRPGERFGGVVIFAVRAARWVLGRTAR